MEKSTLVSHWLEKCEYSSAWLSLDFADCSFDSIVSIDTIYWVADIPSRSSYTQIVISKQVSGGNGNGMDYQR